jgi:hypothetical protein
MMSQLPGTSMRASDGELQQRANTSTSVDIESAQARAARVFRRPEWFLVLLIPAAVYLWFVHSFAVNAIYYDQWDNVALLTRSPLGYSYTGHPTLLVRLWHQHNENRLLFPNLVVLALGSWTHLNVVVEEFLSAVLAILSALLVVVRHRRDLSMTPWVAYLPLMCLMLTLGQYGDTLFGFQLAWYMVLLAFIVSICLLDSTRAGWILFSCAVAAAVIGSYSSLQGLFIWPAGLVVLLARHRPRSFLTTWIGAAACTTVIYFYNFDYSASSSSGGGYLLSHPWSVLQSFLAAVGNLSGSVVSPGPRASASGIEVLGLLILVLAALALVIHVKTPAPMRSPIGPALICFGMLMALSIALGRSHLGIAGAVQSRYATFDLLILAGSYLCLLDGAGWARQRTADALVDTGEERAVPLDEGQETAHQQRRSQLRGGVLVLCLVLIVWMVFSGAENGVVFGRQARSGMQTADLVAAHAEDAPNSLIQAELFPNPLEPVSSIRALAIEAKEHDLSFFATADGARLARVRLPPSPDPVPLVTQVVRPKNGAVLRGLQYLLAPVSGDYPITSVTFVIRGTGLPGPLQLRGAQIAYGWLSGWMTTKVPDGSYAIQSVVHDAGGQVSKSKSVPVTVAN